jgi:hypothetical protein
MHEKFNAVFLPTNNNFLKIVFARLLVKNYLRAPQDFFTLLNTVTMKNVVNWFEIPVKDMARAKSFYHTVLGKELMDMPMEGMEMAAFPWATDAPHASGALVKMEGYEPSTAGTVIYFASDDVANELGRVEAAGGTVVVPKTPIGEHGFFAQFLDCEGNRVALHSTN